MIRRRGNVGPPAIPSRRLAKLPSTVIEFKEFRKEDIQIQGNAKQIEENLKKILEETIQHNVDMMIVTCGYILSPHFV